MAPDGTTSAFLDLAFGLGPATSGCGGGHRTGCDLPRGLGRSGRDWPSSPLLGWGDVNARGRRDLRVQQSKLDLVSNIRCSEPCVKKARSRCGDRGSNGWTLIAAAGNAVPITHSVEETEGPFLATLGHSVSASTVPAQVARSVTSAAVDREKRRPRARLRRWVVRRTAS